MRKLFTKIFIKLFTKLFRKHEHPRDVHARLYGTNIDVDKVWQDRDDLHNAGMPWLQGDMNQMNFEERRNDEERIRFDLECG